jgi:hypothetical protein
MLDFPILRPMLDDHTNGLVKLYKYRMAEDFRETISVEYPVNQFPPVYLKRKNRFDPSFYLEEGYYDIDRDHTGGTHWTCYVSGGIAVGAHIYMQYLANHDTAMADDSSTTITVPDEYTHILVMYVIAKAYRERLSLYMQDPTAYSQLITQMTEMVEHAENKYKEMVTTAQQRLAQSKIPPKYALDKNDRVY